MSTCCCNCLIQIPNICDLYCLSNKLILTNYSLDWKNGGTIMPKIMKWNHIFHILLNQTQLWIIILLSQRTTHHRQKLIGPTLARWLHEQNARSPLKIPSSEWGAKITSQITSFWKEESLEGRTPQSDLMLFFPSSK